MNYDLLIKLARLANNNPNDNEANLAARKVCKILAEGKYEFTVYPVVKKQEPVIKGTSTPYGPRPAQNWYKPSEQAYNPPPRTATKAEERQSYYRDFWKDIKFDVHDDVFNGAFKDQDFTAGQRAGKEYRQEKNWSGEPKILRCTRCGKDISTRFVGPPQVFICFECQFQEHNR